MTRVSTRSGLVVSIEPGGRGQLGHALSAPTSKIKSRLFVAAQASLIIGDRVHIGAGSEICATKDIFIGDDVVMGPYTIIMDSDFHVPGAPAEKAQSRPVHIGKSTRIGAHTTILKGATIGDHVVIEPGSVVSGRINSGAIVSGCPAREAVNPSSGPQRTPAGFMGGSTKAAAQ